MLRAIYRYCWTLMLVLTAANSAFADKPNLPALVPGTTAPNFTAYTWAGGKTQLSDYRGKIVVLDFWASWSGTCDTTMADFEDLYDEYHGKDVVFLAVCSWSDADDANAWVGTHHYKYTFLFDPAGDGGKTGPCIGDSYHVSRFPTTYVIDASGAVVAGGAIMTSDAVAGALEGIGARTMDEKARDARVAAEIADADKEAAREEKTLDSKDRHARRHVPTSIKTGAGDFDSDSAGG